MWYFAFMSVFLMADNPVLSSYQVRKNSNMEKIANQFEVVRRTGDLFEVYVPQKEKQLLLQWAPEARLLASNIQNRLAVQAGNSWNRYKTFEEVQAFLKEMALRNPDTVQLTSIGKSAQGRPIYAVKISDNVSVDENEVELMLTAGTHGDEIITVEVILALMAEITRRYGSDPQIDKFVNERELYFLPVVNPDGFSKRQRYSGGKDPNRAFPTATGHQRFKVDCIEHLMQFFNQRDISASIDFHAFGELVMYPYAETRSSPVHEAQFARLSSKMAQDNRYRTGQISRVLYSATGSSADYFYNSKKTMAFAVEMAQQKAPDLTKLVEIFEDVRSLTWQFIEQGKYLNKIRETHNQ